LSRLTDALANYDHLLNEYFFDRHPGVFSQILNYYRTGKLHYPNNVCGPLFETELDFWGLDSKQVEPCCWKTYTKHRDTEETLATLESLALDEDATPKEELARKFGFDEDPRWLKGTLPWYRKIQPVIWQFFDEPRSSITAKIVSRISIFFITLSILTFCLSTVKGICPTDKFCRKYTLKFYTYNETRTEKTIINVSASANKDELTLLDYIEYFCIAWFTLELSIRLLVAPDKIEFIKSPLNWLDFVANMWFYGDLIYYQLLDENNKTPHPAWDLFGTVRIMRLFKLFHHHQGLKIIIVSLKASVGILTMLVFFVLVAVIIFASLIYFSEKSAISDSSSTLNMKRNGYSSTSNSYNNENEFISIFEACWFSIASLTTVGFGDYVPKTPFGMIFGAMCTVTGVLMIDLPMPIIVANFANYYNHAQARSKLPKKLRRKVLPVEMPRGLRKNQAVAKSANQALKIDEKKTTIVTTRRVQNHTTTQTHALSTTALHNITKIEANNAGGGLGKTPLSPFTASNKLSPSTTSI